MCVYTSVKVIFKKISFCDLAQTPVRKSFSIVSLTYNVHQRPKEDNIQHTRTALLKELRLLWCI